MFILCSIGLQPFSRSEEIQGVRTEVFPKDAQELGVVAQVHSPRAHGDDECQGKTYQEVEKANAQYPDHHHSHVTERYIIPTDSIQTNGTIGGGNGNMADIEADAEEIAGRSGHTQEKAKGDIAYQAACMAIEV